MHYCISKGPYCKRFYNSCVVTRNISHALSPAHMDDKNRLLQLAYKISVNLLCVLPPYKKFFVSCNLLQKIKQFRYSAIRTHKTQNKEICNLQQAIFIVCLKPGNTANTNHLLPVADLFVFCLVCAHCRISKLFDFLQPIAGDEKLHDRGVVHRGISHGI